MIRVAIYSDWNLIHQVDAGSEIAEIFPSASDIGDSFDGILLHVE